MLHLLIAIDGTKHREIETLPAIPKVQDVSDTLDPRYPNVSPRGVDTASGDQHGRTLTTRV